MKENKSQLRENAVNSKETAADKKIVASSKQFSAAPVWIADLQNKLGRRYSIDDNGGGYLGL